MTSIFSLALKVYELLSDPVIKEAFQKLIDWFNKLPEQEQLAYESKFLALGGFGCPCDPNCPDCPDDCKPAEKALLDAAAQ